MTKKEIACEALRFLAIVARSQGDPIKNHLGIECEMHVVDLEKGDQLTSEYIAMNPSRKMPALEDRERALGCRISRYCRL
jgi:hypothetical protein